MSTWNRILKLTDSGSVDTAFDAGAGADAAVRCVAVLPDGRVAVGGLFTHVRGFVRARLAVLNADGTLDAVHTPANGGVHVLLPQADGRLILGGAFTTLGGEARHHAARLGADLAVEAAFRPDADAVVCAGALQADGRVVIGGGFTEVANTDRPHLARLHNEAPDEESLAVLGAGTVEWLRGGTQAAAQHASFAISEDDGETWAPLGGTLQRSAGGWTVTGLSLEGSGQVRARAAATDSRSEGVLETVREFDFAPALQVEQPAGPVNALAHATGTVVFESTQAGATLEKEFMLRNLGLVALTLTGETPVTVTGTDADDFSVTGDQPEGPLAQGATAVFKVAFAPAVEGEKSAVLEIATNDPDTPSFTAQLTGSATRGRGMPQLDWQPTADAHCYAAALQADGRCLVGGAFSGLCGSPRRRFGRLLHSGALDHTLAGTGASTAAGHTVTALAVQHDGRILVAGLFTTVNGASKARLARLEAGGALDTGFKAGVGNGSVRGIAIQDDGCIILCGDFTVVNGAGRRHLARLFPDGTLDTAWNPSPNHPLFTMALQTDGRLLVGGQFTLIAGQPRRALARLLWDGSLDAGFSDEGSTSASHITAVSLDWQGRIYVAGNFHMMRGATRTNLARLNPDGTLDATFDTAVPGHAPVRCLAVQRDGRVIAAGSFETAGGEEAPNLARLLPDGGVDTSFAPAGMPGELWGAALQDDGNVVVLGDCAPAVRLVRLENDGDSQVGENTLSVPDLKTVLWQRKTTAPEVQQVQFDISEDGGATWRPLAGTVARMPLGAGWQITNAALTLTGQVRVTGRTAGGMHQGSSGVVRQAAPIPAGLALPGLRVDSPPGVPAANGALVAFSPLLPGQTTYGATDVTVRILSTGNTPLTGITLSVAAPFSVVSQGLSTLPAATGLPQPPSTLAVLRFAPAALGTAEAQLRITSNVQGGSNPWVLNLRGSGVGRPAATTTTVHPDHRTATGSRLRGSVRPNHEEARVYFQYKKVSEPESAWVKAPAGEITCSGFAATPVEHQIGGLTPATLYHYRIVIYNPLTTAADPVYGAKVEFTTLAA